VPGQRHDGEGWLPSHPGITLKIGGEPALSFIDKDAGVTGSKQRSFAGKQESAAAFQHVDAILIDVRAGNFAASSNPDIVGALHAAAARTPVDEEIVIAIVLVKARGLDGLVVRQG